MARKKKKKKKKAQLGETENDTTHREHGFRRHLRHYEMKRKKKKDKRPDTTALRCLSVPVFEEGKGSLNIWRRVFTGGNVNGELG